MPGLSGSGSPAAGGPGALGAEGQVKRPDLRGAFIHAIPLASAADPVWRELPPGPAGTIEISIIVSDSGKITGRKVPNAAPKHLLALVERTLAQLASGTFALKDGVVSPGTLRLALTVTEVSDVAVPEGQSGGAFGLKSDVEKGTAEFTQVNGRHVEILVKLLPGAATP